MPLFGRDTWRLAATAGAALALSFCGGSRNPGTPTQPVTPPPATPVAPPTPGPPLSASCDRLPLGNPRARCRTTSASFMDEVNDSIDAVKARHPEYFDGETIRNVGAYYVGIIRELDKKGICAGFDGEELAVKTSNDFSDQYKLQTSWNQVRRFYVGSCYPAIFPESRSNPDPSPPGCPLAPSSDITCGDMPSQYITLVQSAISQVIAEKPELFELSSYPKGHPDWPKVKDLHAYQMAVIDLLAQKGFCGKSGEEIVIKKTNDFTENFDINYQDTYVRNGSGIYRGTCYPASF